MKRLLILLLSVVVAINVIANSNCKHAPKNYKVEQRNYIVEKAKLTKKEAQIFFEIYDEMRKEQRKLYNKIGYNKKFQSKTDEECYKLIIERDKIEIRIKKLQQQYHQKMLKALPAKVVMKCLHFAEQFDRKKLREASMREANHRKKRK